MPDKKLEIKAKREDNNEGSNVVWIEVNDRWYWVEHAEYEMSNEEARCLIERINGEAVKDYKERLIKEIGRIQPKIEWSKYDYLKLILKLIKGAE